MSCSFDSNILVYTAAPAGEPRRERAWELLERGMADPRTVLILQTLGEFSYACLRKLRLSAHEVRERIAVWRDVFDVHGAAGEDVELALDAVRDHRLGFWDALLWATARRVGVSTLLSEDLQDGRVLAGVRFVNPFDPRNDSLVDRSLPP